MNGSITLSRFMQARTTKTANNIRAIILVVLSPNILLSI